MAPQDTVSPLDLPSTQLIGWKSHFKRAFLEPRSIWDAPHLRPTASGRAAIFLALRALRIKTGDPVLVPTYHCNTMVAPIVALGAKPVFYPVAASGAPALELIEPASQGARAMIVPHYFGIPTPMAKVRAFCDDQKIALIEDCAHTFCGNSDGRQVGSWGDYAIASLPKFFPVDHGGCLTSWRHPIEHTQLLRRSVKDELKIIANALELSARYQRLIGLNWLFNGIFRLKAQVSKSKSQRMDTEARTIPYAVDTLLREFHSAGVAVTEPAKINWMLAKSCDLARIAKNRRRNYNLFAQQLSDCPQIQILCPHLPMDAVPYVFPIQVKNPERVYQKIRGVGIPVYRWDLVRWPSVPEIPGDVGATWSQEIFQLSVHQDLSERDLETIAITIRVLMDRTS